MRKIFASEKSVRMLTNLFNRERIVSISCLWRQIFVLVRARSKIRKISQSINLLIRYLNDFHTHYISTLHFLLLHSFLSYLFLFWNYWWGSLKCIKNNKARPQHWELRSLRSARSEWAFWRPLLTNPGKMREMELMTYRSYPWRLKCLTICRCHTKGSTFSSVILRPWVLIRSGAWAVDLPHGIWALCNISWPSAVWSVY